MQVWAARRERQDFSPALPKSTIRCDSGNDYRRALIIVIARSSTVEPV